MSIRNASVALVVMVGAQVAVARPGGGGPAGPPTAAPDREASAPLVGQAAAPTVGQAAARLVLGDAGYRAVVRELLGWHGTRHNGCVAFVATALRHVGLVVPDENQDGPWTNPARLTFSLDAHLAAEGWSRLDDAAALVAGDVVFTTGAPDHVMLFHGWADPAARVAVVSDNQRHRYRRPLAPPPGDDQAAFAFARRAPADAAATADLDDAPACADAIALRRRAGRAFARAPGEVTCRAAGPRAAAALVLAAPEDLPDAARLLVLDGRGRVRAAATLPASVDGNGGTDLPALLGAGDLDGDGRLEVWTERRGASPLGSMSGATIELWRERGRRLVPVGTVDGGWRFTTFDGAAAGGEHWEPPADPARQVACTVTITAVAGALELHRTLTVGVRVPPGAHDDCVPFERISFEPRRR